MRDQSEDGQSEENLPKSNLDQPEGDIYLEIDDPPEVEGRVSISGEYPEPEPKEIDSDDIREFLDKKASVEILSQLATGPKEFSEIDSNLTASHGTIANRLTEGARIGIWLEEFHYPENGGKTKLYFLNPVAEDLAVVAVDEEIPHSNHFLNEISEIHEERVDAFRNEITSWE